MYYRGAAAAIIVYDVTREVSGLNYSLFKSVENTI